MKILAYYCYRKERTDLRPSSYCKDKEKTMHKGAGGKDEEVKVFVAT